MKQRELNKLWQRFHAPTFASIGEDEPIFKATLSFAKKSLGLPKGEKVILLWLNEVKEMTSQPCAYFEFADKDDTYGTMVPASETRDLYKWVHNGHPFEVLIHDTDPGKEERYYLPVENLTKIMDYPVYKEPEFTVEAPKLSSKTLQTSLTDAFEQPVKSSLPLDKPLSSVTLGEFLEALKSIK